MNGDDVRAIVSEVVALKTVIAERGQTSELFRRELRDTFHDVKEAITAHAAEDTRRFEKVDTALDHKIGGLYEFLEKQAAQQRTRAWQIAGIVVATALSMIGLLLSASKSGWL